MKVLVLGDDGESPEKLDCLPAYTRACLSLCAGLARPASAAAAVAAAVAATVAAVVATIPTSAAVTFSGDENWSPFVYR